MNGEASFVTGMLVAFERERFKSRKTGQKPALFSGHK